MRALQIHAPGQAGVVHVEDPAPDPGMVLVKVEAVASCPHWDITLMAGRDIFDRPGHPHYPVVPGWPGHEMAGVVEAVGPGVSGFAPGDPVVVWRTMSATSLGYYAEKASVPADDLLPRPKHLTAADAAGFEMAMCVAASLLALPNLSGRRVSVGGLGPAGLIAVQMAKAAGAARVVGFDPLEERRALALTLGADEAVGPDSRDASRFAETAAGEIDYAIDCSGSAASVQFQMDLANGVALFGVQHEPYTYQPRHWLSGLTLYGPGAHSLEAAHCAMEHVRSGAVRMAPLNSAELPLERFAEGTALLAQRRALKVLYRP